MLERSVGVACLRGGAGRGYLPAPLLVLGCNTPTASFSTWYMIFLTWGMGEGRGGKGGRRGENDGGGEGREGGGEGGEGRMMGDGRGVEKEEERGRVHNKVTI